MKHKHLAMRKLVAGRRAKVALVGGLVLVLALMGWGTSALAITWGEADEGNAYPNVGALVLEAPVAGIEPATLPDEGLLDDLKRDRVLREGGPAFWEPDETTRILVGITSWGDALCVVTGFDYRVDIADTLLFIDDVIDNYLP